jgi:c-di-GMP-binding flagellar brake protein YcgR
VNTELKDDFAFALKQGLRVTIQTDNAKGHFSSRGEITSMSTHHFRVTCAIRVPPSAFKPNQTVRIFMEDIGDVFPISVRFIRFQEEGSNVLILSLPSGSMYRNRRAFFRGEIELKVTFKRKKGELIQGRAVNISGGGLLVSVEQSLRKHEELEALIYFSETEIVAAKVRVVRSEDLEEEIRYGVQFTEIARRDQDRICRMVIVQEFETRRAEMRELLDR